jgi:hypothetical protein
MLPPDVAPGHRLENMRHWRIGQSGLPKRDAGAPQSLAIMWAVAA